jgi:hypothetical protein
MGVGRWVAGGDACDAEEGEDGACGDDGRVCGIEGMERAHSNRVSKLTLR